MTSILAASIAWDMPTATVLHGAADLVKAHGLHPAFWRHGVLFREYWPDERTQPWREGLSLSPIGGIGVAIGLRHRGDITHLIIPCVVDPDQPCHDAVVALWTYLGFDNVCDLLGWIDHAGATQVVAALRGAAAAVTCLSCGAPLGQPHRAGCGFSAADYTDLRVRAGVPA